MSISFQRQRGRGAAVFARVDFSGVDKVWGAACDEKKIVLQWIADKSNTVGFYQSFYTQAQSQDYIGAVHR